MDEKNIKEAVKSSQTFVQLAESYKASESTQEKERILSILQVDLKLKEIEELVGEPISYYRYHIAKHHADVWGVGKEKISLPFSVLKYDRATLDDALEFILGPECIQNLAYGERRMLQTDGTETFLPNFQRIYDKEQLWKIYSERARDDVSKIKSRSTFMEIVSMVTGSEQ